LRCPISGSSFGTVGFSPRREGGYIRIYRLGTRKNKKKIKLHLITMSSIIRRT
jgi:hypothetical protein